MNHLNILVSTIDVGINNVVNLVLPYRTDVTYIISHQYTKEEFIIVPEALKRKDIIVSHIYGKGLTISRNNAINLVKEGICIIADDDVKYTNEYLNKIIEVYESDNSIDVACFKIKTENGQPEYKNYPKSKIKISSTISYSPSSIEITFRSNRLKFKNVQFDHRFGIGSPLAGGEEILFIHDCIQANLNVYFVPIYIVEHPFESTIKSFAKYHKKRIKVTGALDYRLNGKISFLRSFVLTLRLLPDLIKNRKNPLRFLQERISGSVYIYKNELKK